MHGVANLAPQSHAQIDYAPRAGRGKGETPDVIKNVDPIRQGAAAAAKSMHNDRCISCL
jgi:hypothetical protein